MILPSKKHGIKTQNCTRYQNTRSSGTIKVVAKKVPNKTQERFDIIKIEKHIFVPLLNDEKFLGFDLQKRITLFLNNLT
jgi:hypothetical protein